MAARRVQQGFRMVTVINDLAVLRTRAAAEFAAAAAGAS
jgi:hypothetical protein